MPPDQAAGLRRHNMQQKVRCIHVFSDTTESVSQLVHALHRLGLVSLLVDRCGRPFVDSPARNLFDWKQQLERGQLQTLPLAYGDGWYAPGVCADEPALRRVARDYDLVVFDEGTTGAELVLMPGAAHAVIIEVHPAHESMLRAYTLLKTLSHMEAELSVDLLGDMGACDQVRAACSHFLEKRFIQAIYSVAREDDAFAALAVRMAQEEASLTTRYTKGNT
jgi:hypothetical protein